MEQIKKWNSLKWRVLIYIPISFVLSAFGSYLIGFGSNYLQTLYRKHCFVNNYQELSDITNNYQYKVEYSRHDAKTPEYIIYKDENDNEHIVRIEEDVVPKGKLEEIGYIIVSDAQFILIPLWVLVCFAVSSYVFYRRELEAGLNVLLRASEKIANNELEFEMPKTKRNEIGLVCDSFETMRKSLYDTSRQNIKILEESRRLNAAFSHDIRTPITVMKGYVELLKQYIPEGKISKEKEIEILEMMGTQVTRLENYAVAMSSIQKLEDLIPNLATENYEQFVAELENSCRLLDERISFSAQGEMGKCITIDKELVFEAVENIVANATRYAKETIKVKLICNWDNLTVTVLDDGEGFSDKILHLAGKPFLREDKHEEQNHFGLGIYIAKLLCEKCGGTLRIANRNGAFVQATFKTLWE